MQENSYRDFPETKLNSQLQSQLHYPNPVCQNQTVSDALKNEYGDDVATHHFNVTTSCKIKKTAKKK